MLTTGRQPVVRSTRGLPALRGKAEIRPRTLWKDLRILRANSLAHFWREPGQTDRQNSRRGLSRALDGCSGPGIERVETGKPEKRPRLNAGRSRSLVGLERPPCQAKRSTKSHEAERSRLVI